MVYDVLGRTVATLADGVCPAGRHGVTFDAAGLPNGVYLVRLEAADHAATHKVLLQR